MGTGAMAGATAEQRAWERVGVTPTVHHLHLPRLDTTVRVQEVGAGPPAVFIHGGSVTGTSWADLAARLPDVRCLLVDRPGCGGSEPLPGALDLARLLAAADDFVVDVLDALDVGSAAVVATSMGGLEALRGAAAHPDRIDRLLLFGWCLGAPGTVAPWWIRTSALSGSAWLMGTVPLSRASVRALLRRFGMERALADPDRADAMLDELLALYRETDTLRNDSIRGATLLTLRTGWRDVVPVARLATIRAPMLLLWGDEDPFIDPDGAARFAAALPDAQESMLRRAGHAPWLDRLETCEELARDFLVGTSSGA